MTPAAPFTDHAIADLSQAAFGRKEILIAAAAHSPELKAAMQTWKEIKFEFDVVDKLARGRLAQDPGYPAVQTIPEIGPIHRATAWTHPTSCRAISCSMRASPRMPAARAWSSPGRTGRGRRRSPAGPAARSTA